MKEEVFIELVNELKNTLLKYEKIFCIECSDEEIASSKALNIISHENFEKIYNEYLNKFIGSRIFFENFDDFGKFVKNLMGCLSNDVSYNFNENDDVFTVNILRPDDSLALNKVLLKLSSILDDYNIKVKDVYYELTLVNKQKPIISLEFTRVLQIGRTPQFSFSL